MSDDGRNVGIDISIPGVLISYEDGQILRDFYVANKDNQNVLDSIVLEVIFEMEHSSNTVKYDLYMASDNDIVYKLLADLYVYQKELAYQAKLTAHYVTYQHPWYEAGKTQDIKDCWGNGKYCNIPEKFGVKDGRVILKENIRQKCVYKYSYVDKNQTNYYWDYMIDFYQRCLNVTTPTFNDACANLALKSVKIPNEEINKCMKSGFVDIAGKDQNTYEIFSSNTLLDQDNQDKVIYSIDYIPGIVINDRNFLGGWRADNVFEAICAGYKQKPEVCYIEGAFIRPSKMGFLTGMIIVILIIAVNVVIFIMCKNYIRKKIVERIESTDINHKVSTVVTSYLALRDNNKV